MIPEYLNSDGDGHAFRQCTICENSLENRDYLIEKSFGRYPGSNELYTVFEYAMCLACRSDMMREISDESKAKIMEMTQEVGKDLENHIDFENPNKEPTHCSYTQQNLATSESYQIVAMISKGELLFAPIAVSSDFIEQYQNILSKETKDFFDDFGKRITDLPPHLAKLLKSDSRPVIL